MFEVRSGAQRQKALLWGGTRIHFGRDFHRLDGYIAAAERMGGVAGEQKIEVLLSNHPANDQTVTRIAQIQANPGAPNPFVIGTEGVMRTLTVAAECAKANRVRFEMLPQPSARPKALSRGARLRWRRCRSLSSPSSRRRRGGQPPGQLAGAR